VASNAEGVLEHYYLSILGWHADPESRDYHPKEIERMAGFLVKQREMLRVIAKYFLFTSPSTMAGQDIGPVGGEWTIVNP
jgi:hypothetical protein